MEVERYAPVFGFSVLFLVFVLFVTLARVPDSAAVVISPSQASSTLAVLPTPAPPSVVPPTTVVEEKRPASPTPVSAPTPAKPTPVVQPTPKAVPAPVAAPAQQSASISPAQSPVETEKSDTAIGTAAIALRHALVNIICYAPVGGAIRSISGSGVFVDGKGIILTNAHIAQYFLLQDHHISCVVRSGSPAADHYTASLMYISPDWVKQNQALLTQQNPSGTGQYDFAFLAVTGSASGEALPASYPSVPLASAAPALHAQVALASYAAQTLSFNDILTALFPTVVFGSVKDVFTFAVDSVDVLELGGSAAAQEGSSGGGVVDSNGSLVATLTTSVVSGDEASRTMHAITASYIRSEYARESGMSLDVLLRANPSATVSGFANTSVFLESLITSHL